MTTKAQRLAKKQRRRWEDDLMKGLRRAGFNLRKMEWRTDSVPTYDMFELFSTPAITTPDVMHTMTVEDIYKAQARLNTITKDTNEIS